MNYVEKKIKLQNKCQLVKADVEVVSGIKFPLLCFQGFFTKEIAFGS